jgi:hypothetical protein
MSTSRTPLRAREGSNPLTFGSVDRRCLPESGSPYTRFHRAVQSDSPTLATAVAHERPQLSRADALRLSPWSTREPTAVARSVRALLPVRVDSR